MFLAASRVVRSTSIRTSNRRFISNDVPTAVYAWGFGAEGQMGFGTLDSQVTPRRMVKSKKFNKLALGEHYTLATCREGYLYLWGKDIGKDRVFHEPTVIPIPNSKKIVEIAAGPKHAAAIDEDGMIYTWGDGGGSWFSSAGKLGHGDSSSQEVPKMIVSFQKYGPKASGIACASDHSVFMTDDGEVLSCGKGEYGRLGSGHTSDLKDPIVIEALENENIISISAGSTHSCALSESGKLFTWGRNDMGQLGHRDSTMDIYSLDAFPRPVEDFENDHVEFATCGKGRTAAITKSGLLYLWGNKMSHVPVMIDKSLFKGMKVKKVALGGENNKNITAVIAEDDSLWLFGHQGSRMLTTKPNLFGSYESTPMHVPIPGTKRVLDVACGPGQHMAVIVEMDV